MNIIDITNLSPTLNRVALRKKIIAIFLDENPGTGKKELTSRYRYVTKILRNGSEVYLSRPANFNNGFDFTLNVSDTNFNSNIKNKRATTRPTHGNIYSDLKRKKKENPKLYSKLIAQINLLYNCQAPTKIDFNFKTGHSTELILECIKWLFAEQDVTYWNYSGRAMFYGGIMDI